MTTVTEETTSISMAEFEDFAEDRKPGCLPTPITQALREMRPGTAIRMSHAGTGCLRKEYGKPGATCVATNSAYRLGKRGPYSYKVKHIGNNQIVIACVEKETQ